jgi:hypothetical protein
LDVGGLETGWLLGGSWSVLFSPPSIASLTPVSGSGTGTTFSVVSSDPDGFSNLANMSLLVNNGLAYVNGCLVSYDRATNVLWLVSDDANRWIPVVMGSAATVQNSQCSLDAARSSSAASGNTLTVNFALTFTSPFSGSKQVYARALDAGGLETSWQLEGNYSVAPF